MDRPRHQEIKGLLRGLDMSRPLAIVMGGSVNGLSFARSLRRRGVPVLMLDSDRLIGTYTRHARFTLLPAANEQPEVWLDFLDLLASNLSQKAVLFPTSDVHTEFIALNAERLRPTFSFLVCDAPVMDRIIDKRLQYEGALEAGVPIPGTHFPQSTHDVETTAAGLRYPCILKPYKSHVGRKKIPKKVVLVDSPERLVTEFRRVSSPGVAFMVQEIIPGGDQALYGYLAFWDGESQERAWLTKQKLRQNPPLYGDGSLQQTVEVPEVATLSRQLLTYFNYRGFVGVEFKYDARDSTYRLMEINPRTVSGNQLAISAGVDFPWLGYQYLTGDDPDAGRRVTFVPGVKYVNEEWDFSAYLALRKTGALTFRSWVHSLKGVSARAIWSWSDPGPMGVVLWRITRGAARRAWHRLPFSHRSQSSAAAK